MNPRINYPKINKEIFFNDLAYIPHPKQWEIHSSDRRFRVLVCGRRWGKTTFAAYEGACYALMPNTRGWVVAPTYVLAEKVFRELYMIFTKKLSHWVEKKSESAMYIKLVNGSEIWAKSADNPDSLLGEGLDWLVIDEAARIKKQIWQEYLRATLADREGEGIFISTPKGRNWFQEMFTLGQDRLNEQYASWQLHSSTNPHLSVEELKLAEESLPKRVFSQEFLAEFVDDVGGVFRHVKENIKGDFQEPQENRTYIIGVDLAKYSDFTVICVIDVVTKALVYFDRFNKIDWSFQKSRIRAVYEKYNRGKIYIDSTGVGDPIFEDLRKSGCNIEGYNLTNTSKKLLVENLALMIEKNEISYPDIPELINELIIYEYEITRAGNTRYNAPEGFHDDCVISLALAAYGVTNFKTNTYRPAIA